MNLKDFIIDGYPVKFYGYRDGRRPNHYAELKFLLLEKYGVCYHCNRKVKAYPQVDGYGLPPDAATIDHLKPRQYRKKYEVTEKVLCCHECNARLNEEILRKK